MFFDPLLYGFVLLGLFTPGPNVIMLTASGVRLFGSALCAHCRICLVSFLVWESLPESPRWGSARR